MRRRRDPGNVERGDIGGVFEHSRQLGGKALELLLGKTEASQAGNVSDVLLGYRLSHSVIVTRCSSARAGRPASTTVLPPQAAGTGGAGAPAGKRGALPGAGDELGGVVLQAPGELSGPRDAHPDRDADLDGGGHLTGWGHLDVDAHVDSGNYLDSRVITTG